MFQPAFIAAVGWLLLCGSGSFAGAAEPTTRPSDGRVLLLPFVALNPHEPRPWLGRSIQQSLAADLASFTPGRAITVDAPASDTSAAIKTARQENAAWVIAGSFATVDGSLRITAQVLDAADGRSVAGIKATGSAEDLFPLEDQLATQLRRRLTTNGIVPRPPQVFVSAAPSVEQPVEPPPIDEYQQAYGSPAPYSGSQYYSDIYFYGNPYQNGYGSDLGVGWPFGFGGLIYSGYGPGFNRFGRGRFGGGRGAFSGRGFSGSAHGFSGSGSGFSGSSHGHR